MDVPIPYWTDPRSRYQGNEMVILAMQYAANENDIGFRYEEPHSHKQKRLRAYIQVPSLNRRDPSNPPPRGQCGVAIDACATVAGFRCIMNVEKLDVEVNLSEQVTPIKLGMVKRLPVRAGTGSCSWTRAFRNRGMTSRPR